MDKLSISVAATPVKDLDVERELPMIKTGLLYGEKIKLYSISVSYLKFIHDFRKMDTKTKEYFVKELMIQINPDVVRVLDYEKELSQKRHKTAEEANFLRERKEAASQLALSLQNSFDKLEINQGYSKLIPALNANLIEMANYSYIDFQDKGFSQEFVGSIINESITGESYPMYDGNILKRD